MKTRSCITDGARSSEHEFPTQRRSALIRLSHHPAVTSYRRGTGRFKEEVSGERRSLVHSRQGVTSSYRQASLSLPSEALASSVAAAPEEARSSLAADSGPSQPRGGRRRRRDACKALLRGLLGRSTPDANPAATLGAQQRGSCYSQRPSREDPSPQQGTGAVSATGEPDRCRSSESVLPSASVGSGRLDDTASDPTARQSTPSTDDSQVESHPAVAHGPDSADALGLGVRSRSGCSPSHSSLSSSPPLEAHSGSVGVDQKPVSSGLRTLQLQTTDERIPAPKLRITPAKAYQDVDRKFIHDDNFAAVTEAPTAGSFLSNDIFSCMYDIPATRRPHRRIRVFNVIKKPLDDMIEHVTAKFTAPAEEELSPRVGYKLCTSSVPKGPVGPRSLMERYKSHTFLPELQGKEGEDINRRLFHARRQQGNRQRAATFFGIFQTFKTNPAEGNAAGDLFTLKGAEEQRKTGAGTILERRCSMTSSDGESSCTSDEGLSGRRSRSCSAASSTFSSDSSGLIAICTSPLASFHHDSSADYERADSSPVSPAPIDLLGKALQRANLASEETSHEVVPCPPSRFFPFSFGNSPGSGGTEDETWASTLLPVLVIPPFMRGGVQAPGMESPRIASTTAASHTADPSSGTLGEDESSMSSAREPYSDPEDMLLFPPVPPTALKYADVFF